MKDWDLGALARAAGSKVVGGTLPERIAAVGTDSRALPPASLFVALRGEHFDGHDFVAAAEERGALAAMVDRAGETKAAGARIPRLVVDDTLVALGEMARAARKARGHEVVAVTGSNGKTTTKEMLAGILGRRGPVHKTSGNSNNLIGLPLTVFAWPRECWAAVLEMGMSAPGEIARLTDIAAPDVGVITMVASAHLEGLGSIEAVARAKGELFEHMPAHATAIVNADDPTINAIAAPLAGARRALKFGRTAVADVRVLGVVPGVADLRVKLDVVGGEVEAVLPLIGPHNAMNAAAAAAAAFALGVSREDIAAGLGDVSLPGGRLRVVRRPDGVSVVDDTYNANPASMSAAFEALEGIATGRRLAVLGEMLELGPTSAGLHREVGMKAGRSGIAHVLALGEHASELAEGARAGSAEGRAYESMESLLAELDALIRPGDWVLVKGSRGMKMERAVKHLGEDG